MCTPSPPSVLSTCRLLLRLVLLAVACSAPAAAQAARQSSNAETEPNDFVEAQKIRIASRAYFSKVAFDRFMPDADFVFFVQKNPAAKAGANQGAVEHYVKWMLAARAQYLKEVTEPCGLERSRGGAPHVVFLLTSSGD
ncbi:MAG: hypothetical protein ACJA2W_000073 [Planctomycetota bacterium]|jgi:hypothetical protein